MKTDELKKIYQQFINSINHFPEKNRQEKLFDQWSLQDLLAHISGWNLLTLNAIKNLKLGILSPWGKGVNEFNKDSVRQRLTQTWQQIYDEFVDSSQKLIKEYESITDKLADKILYKNKKFTPKKVLKIDTHHFLEHLEKIKEKL